MEFAINGTEYRSGKLDAFKQFHVARRLAPLLSGITGALKGDASAPQDAKPHEGAQKDAPGRDFADFLEPMADALARMPDADCDYILQTCLAVVKRQQGNAWAPIMRGKDLMFQDIDMGAMIQITVKVIQENLGGFFAEPAAGTQPKS